MAPPPLILPSHTDCFSLTLGGSRRGCHRHHPDRGDSPPTPGPARLLPLGASSWSSQGRRNANGTGDVDAAGCPRGQVRPGPQGVFHLPPRLHHVVLQPSCILTSSTTGPDDTQPAEGACTSRFHLWKWVPFRGRCQPSIRQVICLPCPMYPGLDDC